MAQDVMKSKQGRRAVTAILLVAIALLVAWLVLRNVPATSSSKSPESANSKGLESRGANTGLLSGNREPHLVDPAAVPADSSKIVGVVREAQHGGPAVGAYVELRRGESIEAQTSSGKDGEFTFDGLKPGQFLVAASASKQSNAIRSQVCDVNKSAETRVDLVLPLTTTLKGIVTDLRGSPIAGVRVSHRVDHDSGNEDFDFSRAIQATTDSSGQYQFPSLLPSDTPGLKWPLKYMLIAESDEYAQNTQFIMLKAGTENELNFQLTPLPALTTIRGVLLDASGLPVAGADLFLREHVQDDHGVVKTRVGLATGKSAADGSFSLSCRSHLEHLETGSAIVLRVEGRGYPITYFPLSLKEGQQNLNLEFRVPSPTRLSGRVLSETGESIGPCEVVISVVGGAPSDGRIVQTDKSGQFQFGEALEGQEYSVSTGPEGYEFTSRRVRAPQENIELLIKREK